MKNTPSLAYNGDRMVWRCIRGHDHEKRPAAMKCGQRHLKRLRFKRFGRVVDKGAGWTVVQDELGETHHLRVDAAVGTRGTLTYRSGPSYGLWFFHPLPEPKS